VQVTKRLDAVITALNWFVDALTAPSQRDRTVPVVLGGYLLVWTLYGVIAKSSRDLHPDMTVLIAWSRDPALGFPKHPPFAAIVVRGWFALFPVADSAFYLLAWQLRRLGCGCLAMKKFGVRRHRPRLCRRRRRRASQGGIPK